MNKKVYRLCLVAIIIVAAVSGMFYYRYCERQNFLPEKGTFVWQSFADETEVDV